MRACLFAVLSLPLLACEAGTEAGPDPAGPSAQQQASADAVSGTGGNDGDGGASSSSMTNAAATTGAGGSSPAGYQDGDRLRAITVAGADGSVQQVAWFDTERGESCSFRYANDGQLRCLPQAVSLAYFTDSTCSVPLAHFAEPCTPPKYAQRFSSTSCYGLADPYSAAAAGTGVEMFQVGANANPVNVCAGVPGACSCSARPAGYAFHSVSSLAASNFVSGALGGN